MSSGTGRYLLVQSIQQIGNIRGKRPSRRVAVNLPQFVSDANPQGASKATLGIITSDSPFRKKIGFPHSSFLHGTTPRPWNDATGQSCSAENGSVKTSKPRKKAPPKNGGPS